MDYDEYVYEVLSRMETLLEQILDAIKPTNPKED